MTNYNFNFKVSAGGTGIDWNPNNKHRGRVGLSWNSNDDDGTWMVSHKIDGLDLLPEDDGEHWQLDPKLSDFFIDFWMQGIWPYRLVVENHCNQTLKVYRCKRGLAQIVRSDSNRIKEFHQRNRHSKGISDLELPMAMFEYLLVPNTQVVKDERIPFIGIDDAEQAWKKIQTWKV